MMRWLVCLFRRRQRRAVLGMTEREIRAALRVGEDLPLWRALHQLLEGQIEAAHEETTDPGNQMQAPMVAYYAGAARHLEIFRDFLIAEREKAMREAEEEE